MNINQHDFFIVSGAPASQVRLYAPEAVVIDLPDGEAALGYIDYRRLDGRIRDLRDAGYQAHPCPSCFNPTSAVLDLIEAEEKLARRRS